MHVMPPVALAKGERSDTPTSTASPVTTPHGCESNSTSGAGVGATPQATPQVDTAEPKPSAPFVDTSVANPDVQVREATLLL